MRYIYRLEYIDKGFSMLQPNSFEDTDEFLSDFDMKILELVNRKGQNIVGFVFRHGGQRYKVKSLDVEEQMKLDLKIDNYTVDVRAVEKPSRKIDVFVLMEKRKCKEIVEQRGIKGFVHFTRIENLPSILTRGIVPVSSHKAKNIKAMCNDGQRLDLMTDCTSCSIEFPNYKLFYRFREFEFPKTTWVVLLLDIDLLYSYNNIAFFCDSNAAGVIPRISEREKLCKATSFEKLYCESLTKHDGSIIERGVLGIRDSYPTDPQAEVLFYNTIDVKYIKKICFKERSDLEKYINKNGMRQLCQFDYGIVKNAFEPRIDYMHWA